VTDTVDPRAIQLAVLNDREAAELWGVTRQYVNGLRQRLGIPHPETAAERRRREVIELWEAGVDTSTIAARQKMSEKRVREVLRLAGITVPRSDLAPCGTRSAYNRHLRRGEPIDPKCSEANNLDAATRRKKGNV
jgi:WhiB family transcriptional regulator, redox-sensing transcriptional regulator